MPVAIKDVSEDFGVGKSAVSKWIKAGMPHQKVGGGYKVNIVDMCLWHRDNVRDSPFKLPAKDHTIDELTLSIDDRLKLRRKEKIELEIAIKNGEYIPIDELDETTSRFAALLIKQYTILLETLPKELSKKTENQVEKILDDVFDEKIRELKEQLSTVNFESKKEEI